MKNKHFQLLPVVLIPVILGCAQAPAPVPEMSFAHRVATTQLELQWNCVPDAGGMTVEGIVRNVSSIELKFVELEFVANNPIGAIIAQGKAAVQPIVLTLRGVGPFRIRLENTPEDARIDMFYQFRIGVRLDYQRFSARNICSPAALRAH